VILWRISNYQTLDGVGGLYVSGRWHTKGQPIIYCSLNPSTSLLETLVHMEIDAEDRPDHFQVLQIEGPDSLKVETVTLPENWKDDIGITQELGDRWLAEKRSLLLKVPSVLAPATWNMLINPQHPDIEKLHIVRIYEHPYDPRLR
jgi:RES domain-containing protein